MLVRELSTTDCLLILRENLRYTIQRRMRSLNELRVKREVLHPAAVQAAVVCCVPMFVRGCVV